MHTKADMRNGRLFLRSVLELAAVTLFVFGTGWAGVRVAECAHRCPLRPGREGVIELRLVKSDRKGNVVFQEGAGYAGWWHCEGNDWRLEWRLRPVSARYGVEIRLANPASLKGESIGVEIGDLRLQAVVPDTGRPGEWKTLSLGEVLLADKPMTLVVHVGSAGLTNVNVKSVTLRPLASAS
jgi:hypothetical protein